MSHDQLDDRLSALFDGPALDLPTRDDAADTVLGRVRRARRRRRALKAGAPALLAVVALVTGLTGLTVTLHDDDPPGPGPEVLTASGIGGLNIGMSVDEAESAGLIRRPEDGTTVKVCQEYPGTGTVKAAFALNGVIVRIVVDAFSDTPEGIHLGDTYTDLEKAYRSGGNLHRVNAEKVRVDLGATRYEFTLEALEPRDSAGRLPAVIGMELTSTTQTC
ncbi:hypothetical protein KIH74_07990 [Kineosporia sp. J2-2]|uniref:DUF4352 domain-containing protein n=1 Tax=Kineosporia corallincola TaxID=2835133 RepID=A0ABS5TCQ0_9ACTN|nr:hypothetical protein [Kineosporia corallincola]MBT0768862.1 hypothetical protein [Kineosporia corallincola]